MWGTDGIDTAPKQSDETGMKTGKIETECDGL